MMIMLPLISIFDINVVKQKKKKKDFWVNLGFMQFCCDLKFVVFFWHTINPQIAIFNKNTFYKSMLWLLKLVESIKSDFNMDNQIE